VLLTDPFSSCKHGLERPPPPPKAAKGKENNSNRGQKQEEVKSTSKVQRLHKNVSSKPDKRLEDLEKRHEGANTSKLLRLPNGQRLKLQSPKTLHDKPKTGKSRAKPTFNLALSDLGESKPRPSDRLYLEDAIEDDEDDLPENILECLDTKKSDGPPNLNKSHAGMDKRALSISSDESDECAPKRRKTLGKKEEEVRQPLWPSNGLLIYTQDLIIVERSPSPSLLFLPSEASDASGAKVPAGQPDDLEQLFDFGFGRASPTSAYIAVEDPVKATGFEPNGPLALVEENVSCNSFSESAASGVGSCVTLEGVPQIDDAMEAFEEWLLSGEVEIV
jgi:hypothetical protein